MASFNIRYRTEANIPVFYPLFQFALAKFTVLHQVTNMPYQGSKRLTDYILPKIGFLVELSIGWDLSPASGVMLLSWKMNNYEVVGNFSNFEAY